MKQLVVLILLFAAAANPVSGQWVSTIGLPAIRNYTNSEFHAPGEIWDICQDTQRTALFCQQRRAVNLMTEAYWQSNMHYPIRRR